MSAQRDEILAFLDAELETTALPRLRPYRDAGAGRRHVERVASAVSSTLEVFKGAAVEGAQLLLVHHGMFWGNEPRAIGAHMRRLLERLFAADITLAAYHLPLDGHPRIGNNARLAEELRMRVDGWFSEHGGIPLAVHGTLTAACHCRRSPNAWPRSSAACRSRSRAGPSACARRDLLRPAWRDRARGRSARRGRAAHGRAPGGFPRAGARARHLHRCAGHHATETLGVRAAGDLLSKRFAVEHVFLDVPNPV